MCLEGPASFEDLRSMLQFQLGQPEVVLWPVPFDNGVFYLKLFLTVHQLRWWGLMSRPYPRGAGVIWLQILHILKLGKSGEAWGS